MSKYDDMGDIGEIDKIDFFKNYAKYKTQSKNKNPHRMLYPVLRYSHKSDNWIYHYADMYLYREHPHYVVILSNFVVPLFF